MMRQNSKTLTFRSHFPWYHQEPYSNWIYIYITRKNNINHKEMLITEAWIVIYLCDLKMKVLTQVHKSIVCRLFCWPCVDYWKDKDTSHAKIKNWKLKVSAAVMCLSVKGSSTFEMTKHHGQSHYRVVKIIIIIIIKN